MATLEELVPERDVKDFRYQQLCRFQISERPSPIEEKSPQLIASSSKYGIIFVGTDKGFKVIQTSELSRIDKEHAKDKTKVIVKDYPCVASIELPVPPSYLALSCDNLSLAVAVETPDLSQLHIYDVRSFVSQHNKTNPFLKVRLSSDLADIAWNPEHPNMLACVMVDGSVQIFETAQNLTIKASLSTQAKATCVCWSPKGKQLVIGQDDGILVQYDQALTKKKEWTCPEFLQGQHRTVGLIWLSTFSFMVAYIAVDADTSDQPNVVLITGGKDIAPQYTSFEDPCFGGGTERQKKYFFNYIPSWEIITATSSTAIEIAVLGKHFDNKNNVERWNFDDSARAEIPLTADHCEAYSMGVTIDYSSQLPLSLTEETSLPPTPILFVLSSDGILIPFYMVYTHPETLPLTTPPSALLSEGARQPPTTTSSGIQQTQTTLPTGPSFQFVQPSSTSAASPFSFSSTPKVQPAVTASTKPKTAFGSPLSFTETKSDTGTKSAAPAVSGLKSESKVTSSSVFGTSTFGTIPASTATPQATKSDTSLGSGFSFAAKPSINTASSTNISFSFGKTSTGAVPASAASTGIPTLVKSQEKNNGIGAEGQKSSFTLGNTSGTTDSTGVRTSQGYTSGTTDITGVRSSQGYTSGTTDITGVRTSQGYTSGTTDITGVRTSQGYTSGTTDITGVRTSQGGNLPKPTASQQIKQVKQQPALFVTKEEERKLPSQQKITENKEDGNADNLDSTFTRSIIEEISHFEEEFKRFRKSAFANKVTVGENKEMEMLKRTTEDITQFSDEVNKITQEQTNEVEDKKSLVLDSFSMVEECKMREQRNTDPKYIHLLRAKTLDPTNQEKVRNLQQKLQILDRGLRDCDNILDNQWEEYQNKNKKITRMLTPTTDLIYRSIKSNRNIILNQKLQLDDLEGQLKQLKIFNKTSTWQDSLSESRNAELSSLADSLLEPKTVPLSSTKLSEPASPHKMARLREHLSRRSIPRIKSTRPENLSMSRIVSAERGANRSPAPVQRELPASSSINTVTMTSLQKQAMDLTGGSIRFTVPDNKLNICQPSTVFGASVQSSGTTIGTQSAMKSMQPVLGYGLEDITPPSSTGYEEDEEDTETENDEDYGFGQEYNMPPQDEVTSESDIEHVETGKNITSTPLSSVRDDVVKTGSVVPNRNLFGSVKAADTNPVSHSVVTEFSFGSITNPSISKSSNGLNLTKSSTTATGPSGSIKSSSIATVTKVPSSNSFDFTLSSNTSLTSFKFGQPDNKGESTSATKGFNFSSKTAGPVKNQEENTTVTEENASNSSVSTSEAGVNVEKKTTQSEQPDTSAVFQKISQSSSASRILLGSNKAKTTEPLFGSSPAKSSFDTRLSGQTVTPQSCSQETTPGLFGDERSSSLTSLLSSASTVVTTSDKPDKSNVTSTEQNDESSNGEPSTTTSCLTTDLCGPKISAGSSEFQSTTSTTRGLFGQTKTTASIPDSSGQSTAASTNIPTQTVQSTAAVPATLGQSSTTSVIVQDPLQQLTTSKTALSQFGQSTTANDVAPFTSTSTQPFNQLGHTSTSTTTSENLFLQKPSSISGGLFGQTSSGTFGQTMPASDSIGQTTTTSESTGLFGQTTHPSASTGLFGQTTTTSGSTGLFGQTTTTSGSTGLFGQTTTTSGSTGLFGQTTTTSGSTGLFGQTTTTSGSTSLFGQTTTTSGSTGLFGQTTTTTGSVGLFGQTPSTSGSTGLFGQTQSTSGSTGLFGQTPSTSGSTGLFGQTPSTSGSTGLFGQTPSTSGSTGLFGQTTTSGSTGLFGQTTTSGSTGLFGQTPSTSGSTGLFGQTSSTSGSTGLFGQTGGLFGQSESSGSIPFDQSTTSDGGPFSQSNVGFGQKTTASTFGQTAFGQSSSSQFGQTVATSSSSAGTFGGSLFGGLGGQPSAEKANTNVFGTTSFGGSSTTNSPPAIFGNQGNVAFGAKTSSAFGGGSFSGGGGGSVAASGFGVTAQQTTGFGGNPSFGGNPAFGGGATFGSTQQAFGSSPTFGSQSAFGSSGFGTPQTGQTPGSFAGFAGSGSSPTFEALAGSSNVPTFGSLSQGQGGTSFGSSPGFNATPSPGFGSVQQQGFGAPTPPSNPSFTGYRS